MNTIIIGAGVAGIAAGRRLAAKGLSFTILEAGGRVGGRAHTDTALFGVPADLGARWIHAGDGNPLAALGREAGFDLYAAPEQERLYIGGREASMSELDVYAEMWHAGESALYEASSRSLDTDCRSVLAGLGSWQPTIEFLLGPYACSKDCDAVSTLDLARAAGGPDLFCRQGLGALVAKLAEGLPIRLGTPATLIDWSGPRVRVETAAGTLEADTVIVTVSTGVLADAGIRFTPALPPSYGQAFEALRGGSYSRVVFDLPGNPFGWREDDLVYAKRPDRENFGILANASGTSLALVDTGGSYAEELEQAGPRATIEAATDFLIDMVGSRARRAIARSHVTQWGRDALFRGGFSAAAPGRASARRDLAEPVAGGRILFAGEATRENRWGALDGAWLEGERAAAQAAEALVPG